MFTRHILSSCLPRGYWLRFSLFAIFVLLALGPFLFKDIRVFTSLASIMIFIVVVAAYDLMLGYTHIVSFAHTIFFGLGAYGVAIATNNFGASMAAILFGLLVAVVLALVLALILGLFSLRVKAIFFALVSLAVAFAIMNLVSKLYVFTGGEDGLKVLLPRYLGPAFVVDKFTGLDLPELFKNIFAGLGLSQPTTNHTSSWFSFKFSGRHIVYYSIFVFSTASFLLLLRLVNSPFGLVLQGIRENEFRIQALGYTAAVYKTLAVVIASVFTCLAGGFYAVFNRYVSPADTLDFNLMIFILLMCVIGGMGSMYGAIIGVFVFIFTQNYLQDLLRYLSSNFSPDSAWAAILAPNHWLLWFGALFIISVYFFPEGIVSRKKIIFIAR